MDEEEIKRRVLFGVGYRSPPEHSRFKKGQSGNPKGRPKKMCDDTPFSDQTTLKLYLDIADQIIQVREGTEQKQMTMREALARANYTKAIKGDSRAQAIALATMQKADHLRAIDIRQQNAFWQSYKNDMTAAIAKAKAAGKSIDIPLPHPDDIVIDHVKGPRFFGPSTDDEQAKMEHTIRTRDILILQNELDRRSSTRRTGEPRSEPGGAELVGMLLEKSLPTRLRLTPAEWRDKAAAAEKYTKRELLRALCQEWQKLGARFPRGLVFPDYRKMANLLESFTGVFNEVQRLPSPDKMPHGEWEKEAAQTIVARLG